MSEKDPKMENTGFGEEDPKELFPEERHETTNENLSDEDPSKITEEEEKKQKIRLREVLNLLKNSSVDLPDGRKENLLLLLEKAIERRDDSESLYFAKESLRLKLEGSGHSIGDVVQAILDIEIPELKRDLSEMEAELDRKEDAANDTATRTEFESFRDETAIPFREKTEENIKRLEELAGFLARFSENPER